HEDNAARAVQAALAIQTRFSELKLPAAAIGLTSGRVFCGVIGNRRRREYTMIGDVVNLAARLMQAALADADGGILCDTATYQAAQEYLIFEVLPSIKVKGKTQP